MKTNELTGAALDWAVAQCEGMDWYLDCGVVYEERGEVSAEFQPSTNWALGGEIIEREKIAVSNGLSGKGFVWAASIGMQHLSMGNTPLEAAMRCYVASKLGDDIEIPEELQ